MLAIQHEFHAVAKQHRGGKYVRSVQIENVIFVYHLFCVRVTVYKHFSEFGFNRTKNTKFVIRKYLSLLTQNFSVLFRATCVVLCTKTRGNNSVRINFQNDDIINFL